LICRQRKTADLQAWRPEFTEREASLMRFPIVYHFASCSLRVKEKAARAQQCRKRTGS
jgi:hypothetical protein